MRHIISHTEIQAQKIFTKSIYIYQSGKHSAVSCLYIESPSDMDEIAHTHLYFGLTQVPVRH